MGDVTELHRLVLNLLGLHPLVLRIAQPARNPFEQQHRRNLEDGESHGEHAFSGVLGCGEPDHRKCDPDSDTRGKADPPNNASAPGDNG